jgi:hypothetical protein
MSPKTTPNAERPSADKLAASAGRAVASPAVLDKGPIPAIVEALHLKSSRKRRQLEPISLRISEDVVKLIFRTRSGPPPGDEHRPALVS